MTSAAGPSETRPAVSAPPVAGRAGRAATGPDPSERDWARTRSSDATAPPPPAADAAVEARTGAGTPPVESAGGAAVRASAARRSPLLVQGLAAAAAGGVLAAAAAAGTGPLVVAVVLLQLFLLRGVLSLLDAPAAGSALLVAGGTALAADVVVLADDGRVDRLAAVVGLGLVAALLAQLARRRRNRVTESLADTLVGTVVGTSAACLLALHELERGREVLLPALTSVATVLLVGRVADRLLSRPALAVGATRAWPGLILGLLAAVGTAWVLAGSTGVDLQPGAAALIALAVTVSAVAADLAVDLGAAELRAGRRDARRAAVLTPVSALLPFALTGPLALLAGRLVLS